MPHLYVLKFVMLIIIIFLTSDFSSSYGLDGTLSLVATIKWHDHDAATCIK